MTQQCIIIGGSHAAAQIAVSLRQEGWGGDVLMLGDEPYLPYHRPPLSKAFLADEKEVESLSIRPEAFYQKNNIQFRQGRVTRIDKIAQTLTLVDGQILRYDKLALCMGSRVRQIALPGSELKGVHYLRNISDVKGIKRQVKKEKRAVIIGGGYIGLEAAASLRKQGVDVVVLEAGARILQRVTSPEVSAFYAQVHAEEGVAIFTDIAVTALLGEERVERVACRDGRIFSADFVIIGIGVIPNVELAEQAGIDVDNGISVDKFCRTNDSNIVAAGDCTSHFNDIYQRQLRLESVPNANEQGKAAAASLCGFNKAFKSLPWFWSDQYDLKLQIAGLSEGYDQVVIRGNKSDGRSFAAFYFKEGLLIAAECVNRPQEFMLSKKVIAEGIMIHPKRLADESTRVKELIGSTL